MSPGNHKKFKSPSAFLLDFPMKTNYMYGRMKRSIVNELFALTICLWVKAGSGPGLGTPFSYAVPGQANELVLIEWGSNPMELLINDKVNLADDIKPTLSAGEDVEALFFSFCAPCNGSILTCMELLHFFHVVCTQHVCVIVILVALHVISSNVNFLDFKLSFIESCSQGTALNQLGLTPYHFTRYLPSSQIPGRKMSRN